MVGASRPCASAVPVVAQARPVHHSFMGEAIFLPFDDWGSSGWPWTKWPSWDLAAGALKEGLLSYPTRIRGCSLLAKSSEQYIPPTRRFLARPRLPSSSGEALPTPSSVAPIATLEASAVSASLGCASESDLCVACRFRPSTRTECQA